jgi:hypothetical protein
MSRIARKDAFREVRGRSFHRRSRPSGRRSSAATVYFVAPLGLWVIEAVAFLVVQLAAVQYVAPAVIR